MSKKKRQPIEKTVKETVDFIFELLISNPDGYEMKAKEFGEYGRGVVTILRERGIIAMERMKGRVHSFLYKWVAPSAPTAVLYGSIAQELRDRIKKKAAKSQAKKLRRTDVLDSSEAIAQVQECPAQEVLVEAVPGRTVLGRFSAQELWDELKKRGYNADEDGLFIVKKTYLN